MAEGYKQSGKGKGKETPFSSTTVDPQLSSSAGSRKSRGAGSETDPTSYHSDPEEDGQDPDDEMDGDIEEEDEEDGSDDVCSRGTRLGRVLTQVGLRQTPHTDQQRGCARKPDSEREGCA
jgi:hypothetical protein